MSQPNLPPELLTWLTADIRAKLAAIKPPHVSKKRATVVRLAYARANEEPVKEVFNRPETCNETIWYTKWQYIPEVKAAFEACYERLLAWADEQTAAVQSYYRQQRLQAIARYAAAAPEQLARVMTGPEFKGSEVISAANALLTWADPEAAGKAQPPATTPDTEVNLALFGQMNAAALDQTIRNLQTALKVSADDEH